MNTPPRFRQLIPLVAMALASTLSGCVNISTYGSARRAPSHQVEVFRDGARPAQHWREIGHVSTEGSLARQGRYEARFLKQAKSVGANAILLNPPVPAGGVYHFSAELVVFE